MPTYYAAGISVSLNQHPLRHSRTSDISRGQGPEVTQQLAAADVSSFASERMKEEAVDCLHEHGDTSLKFLGKDFEAPFYCVAVNRRHRVKSDIDAQETNNHEQHDDSSELSAAPSTPPEVDPMPSTPKIKTLRASTQAQAPNVELSAHTTSLPSVAIQKQVTIKPETTKQKPYLPSTLLASQADVSSASPKSDATRVKALSMTIRLDPVASFCRSRVIMFKDIKIDCYFNGDLSNSVFLSGKRRNETDGSHQILSGSRVHREAEAIWLLMRGEPIQRKNPTPATDGFWEQEAQAEHRWSSVAGGLRHQVEILGINEEGQKPPSARFLDHLAGMRMPAAVKDMQTVDGLTFGFIDVVITLGQGKKYPTSRGIISRPLHLSDNDYTANSFEAHTQAGQIESIEVADDDGTAAVSAMDISDAPPMAKQEKSLSAMHVGNDKDFQAPASAPNAAYEISADTKPSEKRAIPVEAPIALPSLPQARAGEQDETMTERPSLSSTRKCGTWRKPVEAPSTPHSSFKPSLGNALFSFTASHSATKMQSPDLPQNPYATTPTTSRRGFSKPANSKSPDPKTAPRTSTLPLLVTPGATCSKATNQIVASPVPTVPMASQTMPLESEDSFMESMSRDLERIGKNTLSSDTIIYRPQNPIRRWSSRTKIKPIGRARRVGRKPNYAWNTSCMRQTIALLDPPDARPDALLPAKKPTKAKLMLKLKIPSLSPAKVGNPVDFNLATWSRDDAEEDPDFSPSKTRSGKPHSRSVSFGRAPSSAPFRRGTTIPGRGKNWRRGLRKSDVDPSGWEPSPLASRRASPEASAGTSPVVTPNVHTRRGNSRGRGTGTAVTTSDRRGRSRASSSSSPSKASDTRASMPHQKGQDTPSISQSSTPILTPAITTPVQRKIIAPPAAPPNAPPTPTLTLSRPSTPFPPTPAACTTLGTSRTQSPVSIPDNDIPEASKGCIIMYAPGMLRQIPLETTGMFKEEEVLLGVRYIVAA